MARWENKLAAINRTMPPGEGLICGLLVNPVGTTRLLVASGVGGLAGRAIAARGANPTPAPTRMAAQLPEQRMWLAITRTRLIGWHHSTLTGRPKQVLFELPVDEVVRANVEPRKTTSIVSLNFADGSTRLFESPRLGSDPIAFAEALNSHGGGQSHGAFR